MGPPEHRSGLLGVTWGHVPRTSQASAHSLLLRDPPVSPCTLCTSRVCILSGRAKSTGPQQHSTDNAVTTGTLEASYGKWPNRVLDTLTLAPPTPGFLCPGSGMKEQLPEPEVRPRKALGPCSSHKLSLCYFFIAVTEVTYKKEHLIWGSKF